MIACRPSPQPRSSTLSPGFSLKREKSMVVRLIGVAGSRRVPWLKGQHAPDRHGSSKRPAFARRSCRGCADGRPGRSAPGHRLIQLPAARRWHGPGRRICGRHDAAGVADHLRQGAAVRGNQRYAAGHGLAGGQAETFVLRGHHGDRGAGVEVAELVRADAVHEADLARRPDGGRSASLFSPPGFGRPMKTRRSLGNRSISPRTPGSDAEYLSAADRRWLW